MTKKTKRYSKLEIAGMENLIADQHTRIDGLQVIASKAMENAERVLKRNEGLNETLNRKEILLVAAENSNREMRAKNTELQQQIEGLQAERTLENRAENLKSALLQLQAENRDLQFQLARKKQECNDMCRYNEKRNNELQRKEQFIKNLSDKNLDLQSRISELEDELKMIVQPSLSKLDDKEVQQRYNQIRQMVMVMEAWAEGETIEIYRQVGAAEMEWIEEPRPTWDFAHFDYRVKPKVQEPVIVPFTYETMPFPCVVRIKESQSNSPDYGTEFLVTNKDRYQVMIGIALCSYKTLAEGWEWRSVNEPNGWRPCWKEVSNG